jgi:hypothetical protein
MARSAVSNKNLDGGLQSPPQLHGVVPPMPDPNKAIRWTDITKWTPLAKGVVGVLWSLAVVAGTYVWTQWDQQKAGLAANKREIQVVDNKLDQAVEKIGRVEQSQAKAEAKQDRFAERMDMRLDKITDILIDNRKPAVRPMTIDPHARADESEGTRAQ